MVCPESIEETFWQHLCWLLAEVRQSLLAWVSPVILGLALKPM